MGHNSVTDLDIVATDDGNSSINNHVFSVECAKDGSMIIDYLEADIGNFFS